MEPIRELTDKWFYLKIKHKSSYGHLREILEKSNLRFCFLADLPDKNRGCCKRLRKDFLNDRLLVGATMEETDRLVRSHKDHLRYVGQYGKAVSPVSMSEFRLLTLFFDKLDRDFVFAAKIPEKAKPVHIAGGSMAGIEGWLEYRGIGGYRLYIPILDLCTVSVRIDKSELTFTEKRLQEKEPSVSRWYVLYGRREMEYYHLLVRKGYRAYVPLKSILKEDGSEEKALIMRGYVFLRVASCQFADLFREIPGASDRLMYDRSQSIRTPLVIPDKQFEDFVFVTESDSSDIQLTEKVYRAGDLVKLTKKGFEGIEGTLVKCGSQFQVFISLPHLTSGYLIHVEKEEFVKAEKHLENR